MYRTILHCPFSISRHFFPFLSITCSVMMRGFNLTIYELSSDNLFLLANDRAENSVVPVIDLVMTLGD